MRMKTEHVYIDKFLTEHFLEEFYFVNIGYETCVPSHTFGPAIRGEYVLHYVESGTGSFEVDGVVYQLGAGEFFLIRPGEATRYYASEEQPWTYYWIGFKGSQTEKMLALNGITPHDRIGQIKTGDQLAALSQKLLAADLFSEEEQVTQYGLFVQIFSLFRLAQKTTQVGRNLQKQRKYSESFMLSVQSNYYRSNLSIHEIAQSMNLNSSYLTQVIKEELSVSPLTYLMDYRLGKAKVLLSSTDLPVYEIAERVGYEGSDAFSRMFKQKIGQTPTNFRKCSEK